MDNENPGVLAARHDALVGRVNRMEESMSANLNRIYKKLEQMGNRPSWLTVSIISFLSSGFFAMLAVFAADHI